MSQILTGFKRKIRKKKKSKGRIEKEKRKKIENIML